MAALPPNLPPVVADASIQATLDKALFNPADPPLVCVTRAARRRKFADSLLAYDIYVGGGITEVELGSHIVFEGKCINDALGVAPGGAVPGGDLAAGQAAILAQLANLTNTVQNNQANMQYQLNNLTNTVQNNQVNTQNQLANLTTAVNNLANTVNNLANTTNNTQNQLANLNARQHNGVTKRFDETLLNLTNAAGNLCPNFPQTKRDLETATGPELTGFLNHYALPVPDSNDEKLLSFQKFIGIWF